MQADAEIVEAVLGGDRLGKACQSHPRKEWARAPQGSPAVVARWPRRETSSARSGFSWGSSPINSSTTSQRTVHSLQHLACVTASFSPRGLQSPCRNGCSFGILVSSQTDKKVRGAAIARCARKSVARCTLYQRRLLTDDCSMAHKKGQGSSRNGRDSNPKMLGIKLFGGQLAKPGSILCRQNGTKWRPGQKCTSGSRLDDLLGGQRQGTVRPGGTPDQRHSRGTECQGGCSSRMINMSWDAVRFEPTEPS